MRGQAGQTAAVIGGSMAGLFAALRLSKAGWHVRVLERAREDLTGRGAGINTHPELFVALAEVGVSVGSQLGVSTEWRRLLDQDGRPVRQISYPQVNTSWDTLLAVLRRALPDSCYHLGQSVVGLRDQGYRVQLELAGGGTVEADLVVGADGFRSTVRGILAPQAKPLYAGYIAWRAMVDEAMLSPEAHRLLFDAFAMALPHGEEILGYPVAGPNEDVRPGHRRYNVVWYRPADEAKDLPRLLKDATGTRHELSIPPPLIAPAVIDEMREVARSRLPPVFAEIMVGASLPFLQPIYDLESPGMVFGRCALIGDAAFVARPHVGAGVTKAAQDALVLGAAIEEKYDLPSALTAFEARRLEVNRRIVAKARWLGKVLTPDGRHNPSWDELLSDTASLRWMQRDVLSA